MPNKIPYDNSGAFTVPDNTGSYYQDWSFDPESLDSEYDQYNVGFVIGGQRADDLSIDVQIANYIVRDIYREYQGYELETAIEFSYSSLQNKHRFLELTGDLPPEGTPYPLTLDNLKVTVVLGMINENLLQAGQYNAKILFKVYGVKDNVRTLVETKILYYRLDVIYPEELLAFPSAENTIYADDSPPPSAIQFKVLTGKPFLITCPKYLTITGSNNLQKATIENDTNDFYTCDGQTVMNVMLNEVVKDQELGSFSAYIVLGNSFKAPDSNFNSQTRIRLGINHVATSKLSVEPQSLSFSAVRGIQEAPAQAVLITGPLLDAVVTAPPWLDTRVPHNDAGNFGIRPISSANFAPGNYQGEVVISTVFDRVSIFVTHKVVEAANFEEGEFITFCGDTAGLTYFYSANNDATAVLDVEVTRTDPSDRRRLINRFELELAFFENESDFHLGDTVRRFIIPQKKFNAFGLERYFKDASALLLHYDREVSVNASITIPPSVKGTEPLIEKIEDSPFLDGRSPAKALPDTAILRAEDIPIRITPRSRALFNFFTALNSVEIHRSINGMPPEIENQILTSGRVHGRFYDFPERKPGDRISIGVKNETQLLTQDYIVFPEGRYSWHVVWANEYRVQEIYEFTGALNMGTEYEHATDKKAGNLTEVLDKLDTDKTDTITINTGWIPRSNQIIIDEIIMAPIAWLVDAGTGKSIELIPTSKKVDKYDSERATYAFDVEFTINKTHDLKNHTPFI